LIVAVNQNGPCGFSEKKFERSKRNIESFSRKLGLEALVFVRASAKNGDNVASRSKKMKWHRGPSVLEALDLLEPQAPMSIFRLRFACRMFIDR